MDSLNRSLTSLAVWSDQSLKLKDLSSAQYVPGIVKVVRGQYRTIGTERGLGDVLYVHSVQTSQKILTESLRVSGSRIVRSDQKCSLPITYQGWFELMSEDGKPINAIAGAQDLSKIFRHWCLVRESFRAPMSENGADNKISVDQTRLIKAGERLNLRDEIVTPVKTSRGVINKRFLRCADEQGKNVFLSFEQNTFLSPIAGSNNISGVHTLKGLLDKFRFPITVRLVHGAIPAKMEKNWSSVFRFIGTYTDQTVFVLPLKKDATMMTISTREPLQVVGTKNDVRSNREFLSYFDKCNSLLDVYNNSIHVLVDLPHPRDVVRSVKTSSAEQELQKPGEQNGTIPRDPVDIEEEDLLFEEIEEIYRYVRDGGDPPEPKTRTLAASAQQSQTIEVEAIVKTVGRSGNYARIEDLNKPPTVEISNVDEVDNDYWEEPIYADIADIQERKRKGESTIPDNLNEATRSIRAPSLLIPGSSTPMEISSAVENARTNSVIEEGLMSQVPLVPPMVLVQEDQNIITKEIRDELEGTVKIQSPVSNIAPVVYRGNSRLGRDIAQRMSFFEEHADKNVIKPTSPKAKLASVLNAIDPTNKIDTDKLKTETVPKIESVQERSGDIFQASMKRDTVSQMPENFFPKELHAKTIDSSHSSHQLNIPNSSRPTSQIAPYSPSRSPTNDIPQLMSQMAAMRGGSPSSQNGFNTGTFKTNSEWRAEISATGVLVDNGPGIRSDRRNIETGTLRLHNEVGSGIQSQMPREGLGLLNEVGGGWTGVRIENKSSTLGSGLRSEIGVGTRGVLSEIGQVGRTVIPVTNFKSSSSVISDRFTSSELTDIPNNIEKPDLRQIENSAGQTFVNKTVLPVSMDTQNLILTNSSSDTRNSIQMNDLSDTGNSLRNHGSTGVGTTMTVIQERTILKVNSSARPQSTMSMPRNNQSPSLSENTFSNPTLDRNADLNRNMSSSGITTVHVANPIARRMASGGINTLSTSSGKSMPQIVQLSNGTGSPRTNTLVRVQQSTYAPTQGHLNLQSSTNGLRATPFIVNASVLGRPGGATVEYNRRY